MTGRRDAHQITWSQRMADNGDDLETRVNQFNRMALPGQPMGMHMGTSYLINDLWNEVKRLNDLLKSRE